MAKLSVIATGGKQYVVADGETITIEKLPGKKEGDSVVFDSVLLTSDDKEITIGMPQVKGAKVLGTIVQEGREKKKLVFKFKSKTRYKVKRGHRQHFMRVLIGDLPKKKKTESVKVATKSKK